MKSRICFLALLFLARLSAAQDPANDPVVLAVQKVSPAVVNISTERLVVRPYRDPFEEFWRQFFGQPAQPRIEGGHSLGSGVIVDEDGWIVTNWHVVERATKIHVTLSDGSAYEAEVVSSDEPNDLALLRIRGQKPFPYVEIASETEPLLGETVIAVGNPFGLEHTVTRGIISAKNRRYTVGDVTFEDILQTDASINPGNSGGPLVNTRGELVGINMAILAQAQGIGFAVPARRVANLLSGWFSLEKRARLWLGLRFERQGDRLVVADVQPGSPSAKAGARKGDRVVTVDEQRFTDVLRLQRHLLHKKAGDRVELELERDGQLHRLAVTLIALPKLSATELMFTKFGLQVQPLTRDLAEALGVAFTDGLLVADVQRGSPAAAAGLQRGMIITHIGGEEIRSLDRLAEQLADLQEGDRVNLVVVVSERRGRFLLQQTARVVLRARGTLGQ